MSSSWSCCKPPCGVASRGALTVPIWQQRPFVFLGHVLRHVSGSSSTFPLAEADLVAGGGLAPRGSIIRAILGAINWFPGSPFCPWSSATAPGSPEVSSTLWFTPLQKHDHLRIFWSRQVQTPREEHVPSDWEWRSPKRSQQCSRFLLPARLLWDIIATASAG